jgi:hypothetical protein
MRYAASTLGMLDGARVSAPVGSGFAVGAFGGLLPHPMSGAPSLAATRFGVEATYNRDDLALRPDAALVVSGSTFDGRLDERRLSGVASVYPGDARLGAFFQLSAFDRGNPWNASALALTAAGLDASVHAGPMRFGARVDTRTPERSLWLASFLPVTWFCATAPAGGVERCEGKTPTLAQGLLDAGVDVGSFSLSAGVTRSVDLGLSGAPSAFGGFVASRVVRIADVLRLDATGHYSKATYMDIVGGSFGPGLGLLGDTLDVSAYYRGGTLRYSAMPELLVQHAVGGAVVVIPGPTLLFAFQGETLFGDDARALMLFGTATWRPRL